MASTPNERIRAARERSGRELGEAAHDLGVSFEGFRDLEDYEDEVSTAFSLREIERLARILGVTPAYILEGDRPMPAPVSFSELSRAVADAVRAAGGDAAAWGERVGWDVEPLLRDPEEIWNLNVDGLRDIAGAVGIDWRALLPS